MNIEEDDHSKLPVKARISRGKPFARRKLATRGKSVPKGNQVLKNASIVKRQRALVNIQTKNLVSRNGKVFRIKRNVTLNGTEQLNTSVKRRLTHTKIIRNVQRKSLPKNAFPIRRKVEFNAGSLEGEGVQDYYMGNVNYGFENTSGKIPLLPTPLIEEQIFPPYNDNTMNMKIYNTNEIGLSRENEMILNHNSFESFPKVPLLPTPPNEERSFPIDNNIEMRFHYSSRRGLSRENKMFNNQNRNHNVYTESNYQVPVNEDAYYNHRINYQSRDNYNIHQDSHVFHSYYDNMYNQGRIDRNYSEIPGRLSPLYNQRAWKSSFYPSSSTENKFGFVGYPFKNRSSIYKEPIGSERNSRNKRNFVELSRQSTSQGEKSADSFYSYRPHDGVSSNISKGGRFRKDQIDIPSESSNTMNSFSGNSSSNFEHNQATSHVNERVSEDLTGEEGILSERRSSNVNSASSKNAMETTDMGSNSEFDLKKLRNKKKNAQREMKFLLKKLKNPHRFKHPSPSVLVVKIEKLKSRIVQLTEEISMLSNR